MVHGSQFFHVWIAIKKDWKDLYRSTCSIVRCVHKKARRICATVPSVENAVEEDAASVILSFLGRTIIFVMVLGSGFKNQTTGTLKKK